jgi:transcriptional regulator with XRE-family HTH domain
MHSSLGARLREQREGRQITLTTIAEQTKIKLSLLEGLERDDLSHWPEGIFRRSYIRAYAKAVGLDGDAVLREFLSLHPDPSHEVEASVAAPLVDRESASRRPPMRLRFLIGSAIGALPTRRAQPGREVAEPERRVEPAPDREAVVPAAQPTASTAPAPLPTADRPEEPLPGPVDLSMLAQLCTRLASAAESRDIAPVLEDAARLLDAVGLVLWLWDPQGRTLRPVFSHGYPDEIVAQLPGVSSESDTAVAASFRSAETCVVNGSALETGAIVVPLTTPAGCSGVLALELRDGGERRDAVRACATILAAQLSTLVGYPPLVHAASA